MIAYALEFDKTLLDELLFGLETGVIGGSSGLLSEKDMVESIKQQISAFSLTANIHTYKEQYPQAFKDYNLVN